MASGPVPRESCSGGDERVSDQAVGMLEAGRLHTGTVRGREDHEFDVCRVPGDVALKPTVDQQAEPVDGRVEGGLWRSRGNAA